MPIPIDSTGLGGTLEVNDDGSLTFTKDDHLKEEEMTEEQCAAGPSCSRPSRRRSSSCPADPARIWLETRVCSATVLPPFQCRIQ